MNVAIHLGNPHQRLECYNINPALDCQRSWYCPHSGQVTVQDLSRWQPMMQGLLQQNFVIDSFN